MNSHMVRASRSASFFILSTAKVSFLCVFAPQIGANKDTIQQNLRKFHRRRHRIYGNCTAGLDFFRGIGYNHPCIRKMHIWIGIEVVITALTRNQVVAQAARGFESHPIRQKSPANSRGCWTFLFARILKFPNSCVRTARSFSRKPGSNPVLLSCPARLYFPSGSRNHPASEEAYRTWSLSK